MNRNSVKEQHVKRQEDLRLTVGEGRYTGDMRPEALAHVVFLRSPHAHARVVSIDIDAARESPGVLAVLTGEDLRAAGLSEMPGGIGFMRPDGTPPPNNPRPSLVTDRIRHLGEAVVAVVAETALQAQDATELVEIEFEDLPVVTADNALTDGAPLVWDNVGDNSAFRFAIGDAAGTTAALDVAAHVTRLPLVITRVAVNSMETRNVLVIPHEGDRLLVHASHQAPFGLKASLEAVGFGKDNVTVQIGDVGGSFGLKAGYVIEATVVAHAAKLLRRPVIWESTRSEAFLTDDHAREISAVVELGFDAAHRIVAARVLANYAVGAYLSPKSGGLMNNLGGFVGVYDIPVAYAQTDGYFSNTNFLAAYRGAGRPEATYFMEMALDQAARELGLSPFDIRRRNLIARDQMPYKTALTFEYDCGEFDAVMGKAEALADAAGFESRRAASTARGKLRGLGVSNSIEIAGGPFGIFAPDIARIALMKDGRLRVRSGSVSVGQSFETVFPQMIADRFGVALDSVIYDQAKTDVLPFGRGNGGSSATCVGGAAVFEAGEVLVSELTALAARLMDLPVDAVVLEDGLLRGPRNRAMTLAELAEALEATDDVVATGEATFKPAAGTFPNGTHICEVEIDPETGTVDILSYAAVEDIGTVVNPMTAHGQVQGGIVQGIGQIIGEAVIYDDDGQLLTGSFMDYVMPRADDVPSFRLAFHPVPTRVNPLGAKGVGEAGTVGALSASMAAINNALASAGAGPIDMPATPQRVWAALRKLR